MMILLEIKYTNAYLQRQSSGLSLFLMSGEQKAAGPSSSREESKGGPQTGGPPRRRGPLNRRVRARRRLLATSIRPLSPHHTRSAVPDKPPPAAAAGAAAAGAGAAAAAAAAAAVTPLSEEVALLQQGVCPSRLERLLQQQLQRQQQERRIKRREKQQQLEMLRLQQTQQLHALQQRFDFASAAAAAAGETQQQKQQQQQQQQQLSFSPVAEAAALAAAGLLARLRASRGGLQLEQLSPRKQQGPQHQLHPAPSLRLRRRPTIACSSSSSSSSSSSRESSRGLDGSRRSLEGKEQTKNCSNINGVKRDNEETPLRPLSGIPPALISQMQKCFSGDNSSDDDKPAAHPIALNSSSNSSSSSSSNSSRLRTEERGIQVSVQLSPSREKFEDFGANSLSSFNPLSVSAGHSHVPDVEAATVSLEKTNNLEKKKPQFWREQEEETVEDSQGQETHTTSLCIHRGNASVGIFKGDTRSEEEEKENCIERLQAPVNALHAAATEASSAYRGGGGKERRRHLSLLAASAAEATAATPNAAAAAGATATAAAAASYNEPPPAAAAATAAGGEAAVHRRGVPLVLVMREKYPKWSRRKASRIESEGPPCMPVISDRSLPLLLGRERVTSREEGPSVSAGFVFSAEEKRLEEEPLIASVSRLDGCMQSGAVAAHRLNLEEAAIKLKSSRKRSSRHNKALRKEEERGLHAEDWLRSLESHENNSIAADAFDNYENDIFAEGHAPGPQGPHVTSGPLSISTVDDQWSPTRFGAVEDCMHEGKTCFHEVQMSGFSRRQKMDFLSKSFAAKTSLSSVSF
ncbi:hypothetical protein Emed_003158 [Eimeria media]